MSGGQFGDSVAVSGGITVVGAPGETSGGIASAGNVYVYNLASGATTPVMTIPAPNPQAGEEFGASVAVVMYPATIVTTLASTTGTVAPSTSVTDTATVTAFISTDTALSGTPTGSVQFYYCGPTTSVTSCSNTGTAIGKPVDLSSGAATSEPIMPSAAGWYCFAAYYTPTGIFLGSSSTTTTNECFDVADPPTVAGVAGVRALTPTQLFERHAATSESCSFNNCDGLIIVGAPYYSINGVDHNSGQVYVFDATTYALLGTLTDGLPAAAGHFGTSVAVTQSSDVGIIVVGAPGEDVGSHRYAGNTYTYSAFGSSGAILNTLKDPYSEDYSDFGVSVAVNSIGTMVVGAPGTTFGGMYESGAAYIYNSVKTDPIADLSDPSGTACGCNALFGYRVGVGDDYVVVTAPNDATSGDAFSGAAYVFSAAGMYTDQNLATLDPNLIANGDFGDAVAATYSPSFGCDTIAVGAPLEMNIAGVASGNAYSFIFSLVAGEFVLNSALTSPNPVASGEFGTSIAASDTIVLVGALGETSNGISNAGNAYAMSPPLIILNYYNGPPEPVTLQGIFFGQTSPPVSASSPITINFNNVAVGQVTSVNIGGWFDVSVSVPASLAGPFAIAAVYQAGQTLSRTTFAVGGGATTVSQSEITLLEQEEGYAGLDHKVCSATVVKNCIYLVNGAKYSYGVYDDGGNKMHPNVGDCTVGYGHLVTADTKLGVPCNSTLVTMAEEEMGGSGCNQPAVCFTQQNAVDLLQSDAPKYVAIVLNTLMGIQLSQNQLDGLTDLAFNTGTIGKNQIPTTIKTGLSDYCNRITYDIELFHQNLGRRQSEANTFNSGVYGSLGTIYPPTVCYPTTSYP